MNQKGYVRGWLQSLQEWFLTATDFKIDQILFMMRTLDLFRFHQKSAATDPHIAK